MFVAPIPICSLRFVVLSVVLKIDLVPLRKKTSVGAVFAIIPVVIVAMVLVINSNLNVGVLRRCGGRH